MGYLDDVTFPSLPADVGKVELTEERTIYLIEKMVTAARKAETVEAFTRAALKISKALGVKALAGGI